MDAGASWSRNDADYAATVGGTTITSSARTEGTSFISGGQAGYNWQFGQFVVGIEGDIAWRHRTDSANMVPFAGAPSDQVNVANSQN